MAVSVPFIVAGLSYAVLWGTGISEFNPPSNELLTRNGVGSSLELILKTYPVIFLIGCFAALGEELGWRGFLIPKLYSTSLRHPLIASALIWGVWHFPLILWGGYASSSLPLVSTLLFTVIILASGVFVGWLRIQSGSVWVAMVYHAAHNLFLQTAFEVFNKPGPSSEFLGGESGVIPCVVYFLVLGTGWRLMKAFPAKTTNC
ncbi:MAG: CPBP family intramembrane metalloprotease [Bdellovibrionales bacterium]|nr:CPBP family intramembrane metalloprotease [Bdellovibrionales bacterium]